jgi:hypothetical protein
MVAAGGSLFMRLRSGFGRGRYDEGDDHERYYDVRDTR